MKKYLYRIYAGKQTGKGSRDKEGFSHNGEFFNFLSISKQGAIKQFRNKKKKYYIYSITKR